LNSSFVLPKSVRDLFEKGGNDTGFSFRDSIIKSVTQEKSLVDQGLYLDLNTYLVSILNRMDKMSMAAGVEARVPFLDHELVEFAITLPCRWKLNFLNFQTKSILKKLAIKRLPGKIIFRRKSGFGVPISQWLKTKDGLMPFLTLLDEKKFLERGIFRKESIKCIVDDHRKGKEDYSELLWQLINIELWFRLFIDKVSSEKEARELGSDIVGSKSVQ
jgi:asparagine synthase (glutamine-hydrolysing)